MDGIKPPLPPPQHKDHDLTSSGRGSRRPDNAPTLTNHRAEERSPAAMMRAMGFCPTKHMTPLQFLCAVFNDDLDLVFRNEVKKKDTEERGGIGLAYRIEAAKTAAKYVHMEMPKVQITDETGNFGDALRTAASAGGDRVQKRTLIIEEIERISPDIPLDAANYPPHFNMAPPSKIIDAEGNVEGEVLNPEGDRGYNPDDE